MAWDAKPRGTDLKTTALAVKYHIDYEASMNAHSRPPTSYKVRTVNLALGVPGATALASATADTRSERDPATIPNRSNSAGTAIPWISLKRGCAPWPIPAKTSVANGGTLMPVLCLLRNAPKGTTHGGGNFYFLIALLLVQKMIFFLVVQVLLSWAKLYGRQLHDRKCG